MIISILNQKGGVGKTTLSVNLARYFTKEKYRTLLIDTDPQGSALSWHERSEGDLLDMACLCKTTLEKDIKKYLDNYEYIFIDGVAQVSPLTTCAIACSDVVLIPVQPSPYDIAATDAIVRHTKDRQLLTSGKLKISFIVSGIIGNTIYGRGIRKQLEKMGLPTLKSSTYHRIDYITSADKGLTVLDQEYYGTKACLEIEAIAKELKEFIHDNN